MILELPQFSEHTEHIICHTMLSNSNFSKKWGESTKRQRAPKPLALRSSSERWHIEPTHREHLGSRSKANPRDMQQRWSRGRRAGGLRHPLLLLWCFCGERWSRGRRAGCLCSVHVGADGSDTAVGDYLGADVEKKKAEPVTNNLGPSQYP